MSHIPVLVDRVLEGLDIKPQGTYWDGTFGMGGHSRLILDALSPAGQLYASDRDLAAQTEAAQWHDSRFHFVRGTIEEVEARVPDQLDGFLWDLGCSTPQLKEAERGFSFRDPGPLDMRMDREQTLTAAEIVNRTPQNELADLIYQFGEERFSRRIAARIVEAREQEPIADTQTLADICRRVYPGRRRHRIDPATRTFQALRIVVNDELGQVTRTLPRTLTKLRPGGRAVVISFHSLEDRIVKHTFREHARAGGFRILTKKPLIAEPEEVSANPAARSAKLRVLERLELEGDE